MKFRFSILLVGLLFEINAIPQPLAVGWASVMGGTTGGGGGDTIKVKTREDLLALVQNNSKAIIVIEDTINLIPGEGIEVISDNISIIGYGQNAMIRFGGLKIYGNNIIIRNLSIGDSYVNGHWDGKGDPYNDALSIYGKHIWIDHCDLFHSYDGLLDISRNGSNPADYITVSWTRFWNHNKVMLIGSNDQDTICRGYLNVTVHHCWFDGFSSFYDDVDQRYYNLTQRMPRVRFGNVHVYNNYYESVSGYCIAARFESKVVVEENYFRNLEDAHIIDDQGKGLRDPELVAVNNIYDHTEGEKATNGSAFDPLSHYDYETEDPSEIPTIVMNGAGKTNRRNNHPPVAINDTVILTGDQDYWIKPLVNDSDIDNDSIRISVVLNEPRGEVIVYPTKLHYSLEAGNIISDTIVYQIIDYQGGVDEALIFILPEDGMRE